MIHVTYAKIQPKIKTIVSYLNPLPLCEEFVRGVYSQCRYKLFRCIIIISIDVNTSIKGVQKDNHEKKILNFADDTTIFLTNLN